MIRLNVPYREKDEAKRLGARWNYTERFWYCEDDQAELFARWYVQPAEPKKDADGNTYETVTAINEMIAQYFENNSQFQLIRVRGEISNHSLWNGHHFFTIKDSASVLKCILWKDTAQLIDPPELTDGQEVGIVGSLRFNGKRSEGELIVARIHDLGEGGEGLELKLLRERLQAEGLFDPEHKKPLPKYPKRIGIVTSGEGDAIRDICRVAHDRNPYVQLFLYSVTVQGDSAPASIIRGIKHMDGDGYDLIIVSRGGGSREDLSPFDDEGVVRAVFAARTPIVTGVGHERDVTLIDLVADVRFSTPTYAAQGVIPDVMSDIRRLRQAEAAIYASMAHIVRRKLLLLETRRERLERYNPEAVLNRNRDRLARAEEQLHSQMRRRFDEKRHRFELLVATLHGLSPTAKLMNGFGYVTHEDKPVLSVSDTSPGQALQIRMHDGVMTARVEEIHGEKV